MKKITKFRKEYLAEMETEIELDDELIIQDIGEKIDKGGIIDYET